MDENEKIKKAAAILGRKGGSIGGRSASDAKTAASRANGRRAAVRSWFWILSGEGEIGSWTRVYTTPRGASSLAREARSGGDRWAQIWIEVEADGDCRRHISRIDDGSGDMRDVPPMLDVTVCKGVTTMNAYETAAMRDLLDASDLFARARDVNASLACQAWACDPAAHVEAIADLAAKTGGMAATRLRAAAEQARMAARRR